MKGRVRRNQWIEGVVYNGPNILLMRQRRDAEEAETVQTTVFVCDDFHLKVGEMRDKNYTARCVLGFDPGMRWNDYDQYFPEDEARVFTCYLKATNDLEGAAYELARYIKIKEIKGKVLLVGYSYGGLVMYRAGTILPEDMKRRVTVMTIASPFKSVATDNFMFQKSLEPLPLDVNHVAFISSACERRKKRGWSRFFQKGSENKEEPLIPFFIQDEWPIVKEDIRRNPDMCLTVSFPLDDSLERILADFGEYVRGENLFSRLDEFKESDAIQELVGKELCY